MRHAHRAERRALHVSTGLVQEQPSELAIIEVIVGLFSDSMTIEKYFRSLSRRMCRF